MGLTSRERDYLENTRIGHLGTANRAGVPSVVPVCFALLEDQPVSPIDEKEKSVGPNDLRRVRDIRENPRVSLTADRYSEDWSRLSWLQIRGEAAVLSHGSSVHSAAVKQLRKKYPQYQDHTLEVRPIILLQPERSVSWGVDG